MASRLGVSMQTLGLLIVIVILAGVAAYGWVRTPSVVTVTQTVTVPGAAQATQTVTSYVTVTASPAAGAVSPLSQLKVGLILPIDETDLSWNYAAWYAVTKLQEIYGFDLSIHRQLFDGTKAEPVAIDLARRGYDVIILQGIQYMEMAQKIAPQFPKTLFVCVDCFQIGAPNVYNIWMTLEEGAFVLGIAAGLLTKSNVIGLIGGGRVPSIWAGHEAFKAGVLLVNPNVRFLEYYAPLSWADVAGARRAAESFIAQGADVIFSSGDGIDVGVSLAASERKVWFTTVYVDIPRIKPMDTLLGSIVFNWDVVFSKALIDKVTDNWRYGFLTATMASGIIKVSFGPNVPEDVKNRALRYQNMILMGLLKIYFDVDPVKGVFKCFDNPDLPECKPTAAKVTFKG